MTIKVITVEDYAVMRQGIKTLVQAASGMEIVAEGMWGKDVLPLVQEHKPDALLLDIHMKMADDDSSPFPVMTTVRHLREQYPDTVIIIFSMYISHTMIEGLLERGIRAYIYKGDDISMMLPDVIRGAVNGIPYLSESIRDMMQMSSHADALWGPAPITPRQKEILQIMAQQPEMSLAEIAELLGMATGTLKNHLTDLYSRLGVSHRMSAIIECIKRGWIVIGD